MFEALHDRRRCMNVCDITIGIDAIDTIDAMTVGIGINSQVTSTCDLYVRSTGLDEYQSILVRYSYGA